MFVLGADTDTGETGARDGGRFAMKNHIDT